MVVLPKLSWRGISQRGDSRHYGQDTSLHCEACNILGLCPLKVSSAASTPTPVIRQPKKPLYNPKYDSQKGSSAPGTHYSSSYFWDEQDWSSWIVPPASYQLPHCPDGPQEEQTQPCQEVPSRRAPECRTGYQLYVQKLLITLLVNLHPQDGWTRLRRQDFPAGS